MFFDNDTSVQVTSVLVVPAPVSKIYAQMLRGALHCRQDGILSQRVHVSMYYVLGPQSGYMGNPLGPRYIRGPYMEPLGNQRHGQP